MNDSDDGDDNVVVDDDDAVVVVAELVVVVADEDDGAGLKGVAGDKIGDSEEAGAVVYECYDGDGNVTAVDDREGCWTEDWWSHLGRDSWATCKSFD